MKQRFIVWVLSFFDSSKLSKELDRRYDVLREVSKQLSIESKKDMDKYIESIGGLDYVMKKIENHPIPLAYDLGNSWIRQPEVEINSLFHETKVCK